MLKYRVHSRALEEIYAYHFARYDSYHCDLCGLGCSHILFRPEAFTGPKTFWGVMLGLCGLQCLGYLLYSHFAGNLQPAINLYYWFMGMVRLILLFCVFPRQTFKNLFFYLSGGLTIATIHAAGTIVESSLTSHSLLFARAMNRLAVLLCLLIVLPLMYSAFRRIQRYLRPEYETPLWRLTWIIPAYLFALLLITSSQEMRGLKLPGMLGPGLLIFSRIIILLSLWVMCYITAEIMKYSQSAQLYQMRAEHAEQELELHKQLVSQIPEEHLVVCGPFTLNAMSGQAFLENEDLLLAPKEFSVLLHLIGHENETVNRESMYEAVWRQKLSDKDRALISCVSRLRRKIEGSGYRITSMRGQGYRLEKDL